MESFEEIGDHKVPFLWYKVDVEAKVDRKSWTIGSLDDPATLRNDEIAYWLARSPADRLAYVEQLRQINYGYDPSTARLQRILEFSRLA